MLASIVAIIAMLIGGGVCGFIGYALGRGKNKKDVTPAQATSSTTWE